MSLDEDEIEAVLIAGPTASGKSQLALDIAAASGGTVVNADSMQVYDGLRILTARPSDADLAAAPHGLYGHVAPTQDYSAGEWARDAAQLLFELRAAGSVPIVCGGTGLYFRALLGGLDDMPSIPSAVRAFWRDRMAEEGPGRLHAELARRDPDAASRLKPGDLQRIVRALEIVETTGAPLADLQRGGGVPLIDHRRALKLVLTPPREALRASISRRFDGMLDAGAVEEAKRFAAIPGARLGTAGKAIGVEELNAHINGRMTLPQAAERAVTRSRQYAKRQDTWFRHQCDESWTRVSELLDADRAKLIDRVKARSARNLYPFLSD